MCFVDDAEWYADDDLGRIQVATEQTVCDECGCVIPKGDALLFVHQIEEWDEEAEDGSERDEYQNEYRAWICGACDLTRFRIHLHELHEGCQEYESWCPYGLLRDHCHETDFEMSNHDDGQAWLKRRLQKGGAL